MLQTKTILIVDLQSTGHHIEYISYLCRNEAEARQLGLKRRFVVPKKAREATAGLISEDCFAIVAEERISEYNSKTGSQRAEALTAIVRDVVSGVGHVDAILFLYLDEVIWHLGGSKLLGIPLFGIFFRPRYHYLLFPLTPKGPRLVAQCIYQWLRLWIVAQTKATSGIFLLDPLSVQVCPAKNVRILVDPIETQNVPMSALPPELSESYRESKVVLAFGEIDARKGLEELVAAFRALGNRQHGVRLVIAGRVREAYQSTFQSLVAGCQDANLNIVFLQRRLEETEMNAAFKFASVVTVLYRDHVGMSGVLNRAACYERPVLASSFGTVGELVRRHNLGLCVDPGDISACARALERLLNAEISPKLPPFMQNASPEAFASCVHRGISEWLGANKKNGIQV